MASPFMSMFLFLLQKYISSDKNCKQFVWYSRETQKLCTLVCKNVECVQIYISPLSQTTIDHGYFDKFDAKHYSK